MQDTDSVVFERAVAGEWCKRSLLGELGAYGLQTRCLAGSLPGCGTFPTDEGFVFGGGWDRARDRLWPFLPGRQWSSRYGAGCTASLRSPWNGGSVAASALGADEESAVLGQTGTQFPTRADTELGEHLAEMPLHRARAQEELRADLPVGQAVSS